MIFNVLIRRRLMRFRFKNIKQLKFDFLAPVFLVPAFMFFASLNFYSTIFILFIIPILGGLLYLVHSARQSGSKLFFMWTIVSLFFIFACLEFLVVPLMVVSPWENISFYVLLIGVLLNFRNIKKRAISLIHNRQRDHLNECSTHIRTSYCLLCSRRVSEKFIHCGICRVCVFERSHHSVWINCCISRINRKQFFVLHIFMLCWLTYTSYLILTTVCMSSLLYNAVLLPEDCSRAYSSLRSSFSFVGAVYSLEIGVFVFISLIREGLR